jgi:hypothetical protein
VRISREALAVKIMIDQKPLENEKYFNYFGSVITNDARYTRGTKTKIFLTNAAFQRKNIFTSKHDLNLRKKLVKCYIRNIPLYGAESWTLRKVDQK